ncbi:MAG: hypothetical protein RRY12_10690 [Cloacibacillus sp.]
MEEALLLFSNQTPYWDEEAFSLAGEDPSLLSCFLQRGYAELTADGYGLTAQGTLLRDSIARELYVNMESMPSNTEAATLWENKLLLLMDKAFVGNSGIKEYTLAETLPVVPYLSGRELWTMGASDLNYTWQTHPMVDLFLKKFPNQGVMCRYLPPVTNSSFHRWIQDNKIKIGSLKCELILRNRYDFELYRKDPPLKNDVPRMKDADRFFFIKSSVDNIENIFERIGQLHLFLLALRHVYIPGYADFDSHLQENWTVVVLTVENEIELEKMKTKLAPFAMSLIRPALPLFVIMTSFERLRSIKRPRETVYDWFCEDTEHIARADNISFR